MSELFRVFVASPGDVHAERQSLNGVIDLLNQTLGWHEDIRLELVRWETHADPALGRPQGIINEQIPDYDIFVGIMWSRFGMPTGEADSGTEEEFNVAFRRWQADNRIPVMFYFCKRLAALDTVTQLEQKRKVLEFEASLKGKALTWAYEGADAFATEIHRHLYRRVVAAHLERKGKSGGRAKPEEATVQLLRSVWPRMEPALQQALTIAYNENRQTGDPGVQTSDLFAALQRVHPPSLKPFLEEIPRQALPAPTDAPVSQASYIEEERPWLSACVTHSLQRLSQSVPPDKLLTAAEIFADIAKNGNGRSVALLRQHKIGPAEIDDIIRRRGVILASAG